MHMDFQSLAIKKIKYLLSLYFLIFFRKKTKNHEQTKQKEEQKETLDIKEFKDN